MNQSARHVLYKVPSFEPCLTGISKANLSFAPGAMFLFSFSCVGDPAMLRAGCSSNLKWTGCERSNGHTSRARARSVKVRMYHAHANQRFNWFWIDELFTTVSIRPAISPRYRCYSVTQML